MNWLSFQVNNNPRACLTGGVYKQRKKITIELSKLDCKDVYEFSDIRRIPPLLRTSQMLPKHFVKLYLVYLYHLPASKRGISVFHIAFHQQIQVPYETSKNKGT